MNKTQVVCFYCQKSFLKENRYINRTNKKGKNHFCSISCATKYKLYTSHPQLQLNCPPGKLVDIYSPFRRHYLSAKSRCNNSTKEFTITLDDLLNQWNYQNGLCAISGIKLFNYSSTKESRNNKPNQASLDRIDNLKGYTKDNIQWVCLIAQYAKNTFTQQDVINFCQNTVQYQGHRQVSNPNPYITGVG
jgi:hypothetical protein